MIKIQDNTINQSECKHCKGKGYVIITVVDAIKVNKNKREQCVKCGGTGINNDGK